MEAQREISEETRSHYRPTLVAGSLIYIAFPKDATSTPIRINIILPLEDMGIEVEDQMIKGARRVHFKCRCGEPIGIYVLGAEKAKKVKLRCPFCGHLGNYKEE